VAVDPVRRPSVVAGAVALINPGLSLLTIALLFGCYLIVAGFFDLLAGVTATDADPLRRIFAVVLAILSLMAGVVCLLRPGRGAVAIAAGLQLRRLALAIPDSDGLDGPSRTLVIATPQRRRTR
jgi:short repeat uncharacterized protein DUF308